jgi:putative ABC transport system permease protein
VMPADFQFPLIGVANIWAPLALSDKDRNDHEMSWFNAFGRLKAGVTPGQAGGELSSIAASLEKQYPKTNTNLTTLLSPMTYEIQKEEGAQQLMIAFWVVGLVLLIACANVANLLLARGTNRAKELAVRRALGGTRGRLIRQLLTEAALLFLVGGAAGTVFAVWGVRWIEQTIPDNIRGYLVNFGRADLDFNTLAYIFGTALICGIIFGVAPAFETSSVNISSVLKESAVQASGSRHGARLRRVFVAAEIAMGVIVLVCTTLLVQSFIRLVRSSLGFRSHGIVTAELVVPKSKYAGDPEVRDFYDSVLARVRALPGVAAASAGEYVPFVGSNTVTNIHIAGRPPAEPGEEIGAEYSTVLPDYFSTMQIPLIRGRLFNSTDAAGAPNAVLINETLARQQFSNQDPLGMKMEFDSGKNAGTIVGVVGDIRQFDATDRPEGQFYVPFAQFPSPYMSLVVRALGDPSALAGGIRDAVWAVDREQPVSSVRPLDDLIAEKNSGNRILTEIMGFFGVLALFLAAIGIYGLMSQFVMQRTHEIGIRMALGARPREVLQMIVAQGLRLTLAGIAAGIVLALGATQVMAFMLFNVNARDPLTFIIVPLVFTFFAMAACFIPAWRAMNVDPMVALRYE